MDNLRFCNVCKLSKEGKDFLPNQDDCYRCVYEQKVKKNKILHLSKICKICKNPLPNERWSYCSKECGYEAKKRNRHWTHQVKTDNKNWKKRFIF